MKERLIQLINFLKYKNQREFAIKIGISQSIISQYKKYKKEPGYKFWRALEKAHPEINVDWLKTGTGSILKTGINDLQTSFVFAKENDHKNKDSQLQKNILNINNETFNDRTKLEKSIEKILVFYSDRTFKEYFPE
jgi:transcriptional regulator with XRE-family HTH domain